MRSMRFWSEYYKFLPTQFWGHPWYWQEFLQHKDNPKGHRKNIERSRLYQIIVSEAAYLIWRLRNNRVINEKACESHTEAQNRLDYIIKNREKIDSLLTNKYRYKRRAMKKGIVRNTWEIEDNPCPTENAEGNEFPTGEQGGLVSSG
jgi:hypothetical protein